MMGYSNLHFDFDLIDFEPVSFALRPERLVLLHLELKITLMLT